MKKSKKILKYCLNFDDLVKEAQFRRRKVRRGGHPLRGRAPASVPASAGVAATAVTIPEAPGALTRFKNYFFPKASNPFLPTAQGPTTILSQLAKKDKLTLNDDIFRNDRQFKELARWGKKNGIIFETNPNSINYRRITSIDVSKLPREIYTNFNFSSKAAERAFRQEVVEYNKGIQAMPKGSGQMSSLKTPWGRQGAAIKNRAWLGAAALGGASALYFIFSGGKSPSTESQKKKEVIDDFLSEPGLSEIPSANAVGLKIRALNSKLQSMGSANPALADKLKPFINQGNAIISNLESLSPDSMNVDAVAEVSAYARSVSTSMSSIRSYLITLRRLYNIMVQANKRNTATQISEIYNSLNQYIRLVSQYQQRAI